MIVYHHNVSGQILRIEEKMAYQVSEEFSKTPQECYTVVLNSLETEKFTITRRRDIAWLVQVRKSIQGDSINLNIQCRAGTSTQLIISSQGYDDSDKEKAIIESLLRVIKDKLK